MRVPSSAGSVASMYRVCRCPSFGRPVCSRSIINTRLSRTDLCPSIVARSTGSECITSRFERSSTPCPHAPDFWTSAAHLSHPAQFSVIFPATNDPDEHRTRETRALPRRPPGHRGSPCCRRRCPDFVALSPNNALGAVEDVIACRVDNSLGGAGQLIYAGGWV